MPRPRARARANQQGLTKIALVHFLRPDQELVDPYYVGLRLGIESRCQTLRIETVKVYHSNDLPDANVLQSASRRHRHRRAYRTPRSTGSSASAGMSCLPISRRPATRSTRSSATSAWRRASCCRG